MSAGRHARQVLITRGVGDAGELADRLRQMGYAVLLEPLLKVNFFDGDLPELSEFQALLFTSRNGVRAYCRLSDHRGLTVYAVGDGTAQAAREAGFHQVESAGGNVEALVLLVSARAIVSGGPLLHIAGSITAGNLAGDLEAVGFRVRRAVLYESVRASAFSTRTTQAFEDGDIGWVTLFSPRTARTFASLVKRQGIARCLRETDAVCLSGAVADEVEQIPWRAIKIAEKPTFEMLIQLLHDDRDLGASNGE